MGTIRVIFIAKGFKKYATIIGFFEILVWLAAINQIMNNLTNYFYYFAYAAGFASGTYVGMKIEEKISFGKVSVRIITRKNSRPLLEELKKAKHTVTSVGAHSQNGKVRLITTIIDRKDLPKVAKTIKKYNPRAFYSTEDVRFASEDDGLKSKRVKSFLRLNFHKK